MGFTQEMLEQLVKEFGADVAETARTMCLIKELAAAAGRGPWNRVLIENSVQGIVSSIMAREIGLGRMVEEDIERVGIAVDRLWYAAGVEAIDREVDRGQS